ncbi:MAG: SCO4402 family protein [Janthinobacterium lividum]
MTQTLGAPGLRYQLIWQLNDFARPELHKSMFCSQKRSDAFSGTVIEPILCIFDNWFESSSNLMLGEIFRDMNEIEYMRRLGVKLRELLALIQENGQQKDSFYMNSTLWQEITQRAKEAYDVLTKDEDL